MSGYINATRAMGVMIANAILEATVMPDLTSGTILTIGVGGDYNITMGAESFNELKESFERVVLAGKPITYSYSDNELLTVAPGLNVGNVKINGVCNSGKIDLILGDTKTTVPAITVDTIYLVSSGADFGFRHVTFTFYTTGGNYYCLVNK